MSEKINNAITTLDGDLLSSGMLFIVKSGEGDLFDTVDYPYKLTIEQYQGTLIKKREVLTIENRTGDAFTVSERASEACVQDETISPKVRTQNALSFLSGDTVRMTITEEDWNETQEEIFTNIPADLDLKLNITDFQNQTAIYGSSSTGTDAYAITLSPVPSALVDLKGQILFLADVGNTGSATLNINSLGAKTIKKANDVDLATGDIEANQIVGVIYNSVDDVFEMVSQTALLPTVDINGLTKKTTPIANDFFIIYDTVSLNNKKTSIDNVLANYNGYISSATLSSSGTTSNNIAIPAGANFAIVNWTHTANTGFTYSQKTYGNNIIGKQGVTNCSFGSNSTQSSDFNVNVTWGASLNFTGVSSSITAYTANIYFYKSL